jgi:hypothetical protein
MNKSQAAAVAVIRETLLLLPWAERAEVFKAVEFNDVFCVRCGYGEVAQPNPNCQCTNDE